MPFILHLFIYFYVRQGWKKRIDASCYVWRKRNNLEKPRKFDILIKCCVK